MSTDELAEMDAAIESAREQHRELRAAAASAAAAAARLRKAETTEELRARVAALEEEVAAKRKRVESLEATTGKVDPRARDKLKRKASDMVKLWRKRRRLVMDAVDMMADGLEKKPKDVMKLVDVETDEAAGVSLKEVATAI